MIRKLLLGVFFATLAFVYLPITALGAIESIEQVQPGPFTSPSVSFSVVDNKFGSAPAWTNITNIDVRDIISLRVKDAVRIQYPFNYTVYLNLVYYTADGSSHIDNTHSLTVSYDPNHGATYKGLDTYEFTGAYQIDVTVASDHLNSGTLPSDMSALELCSRLVINRRYTNFTATAPVGPTVSAIAGKQLPLSWTKIDGAEEYDIEWTTINNGNPNYPTLDTYHYHPGWVADADMLTALDKIFRNNSSRITTDKNTVTLPVISTDDYFLVRIRTARYLPTQLRDVGAWDYRQDDGTTFMVIPVAWNDHDLNWQYSAAYAEDGKRKEVINYFDGSLRGRQTVTLNNSDNIAVVQENVYDEFGRVAANILPAPVNDAGSPYLRYVPNFNMDPHSGVNKPYSFENLNNPGTNCENTPDPLLSDPGSTAVGTAQYYSGNNKFLSSSSPYYKAYNKYIPDATGTDPNKAYPFSVTQYTADNTGRVKLKGGVGAQFQPGTAAGGQNSQTTKYYYGKPEQWELDQLFGNDVGYAEHYAKNMVVDPNGQISISYLNASGKTIATALAGLNPASLEKLDSYSTAVNNSPADQAVAIPGKQHIHLLKPEQFVYDASKLKLSAHTTYLASTIDMTAQLSFDIQKLVACYPSPNTFCTNCFYHLTVTVNDDCGDQIGTYAQDVQLGTATTPATITVPINHPGEYYVDIEFAFDPDVINTQADNFAKSSYVQKQFDYIKANYLDGLDVSGCYSDCHTCKTLLADANLPAFKQAIRDKCIAMGLDATTVNTSTDFDTWLGQKYTDLKSKCTALQATCKYAPCDATRNIMLTDISPGGQYALFDQNGVALEQDINVLYREFQKPGGVFTTKPAVVPDNQIVTLDNGLTMTPYDSGFTLAMLVKYWNPAWAELFLPYHPEACKLTTCELLSNYKDWDMIVQSVNTTANITTTIPGVTTGWAHDNALSWLLDHDPFFNDASTSANPTGSGSKSAMLADITNYSVNVLYTPLADRPGKDLQQYVDYLLYCQDSSGNTNTATGASTDSWSNCSPAPACRVPDREWTTYRDLYLELKQKYYQVISDARCGGDCPIGHGITYSTSSWTATTINDYIVTAGSTVCDASHYTAKVTYIGATPLTNSGTVVYLSYPTGSVTTGLPASVTFSASNPEFEFCVSKDIPISSIVLSSTPVFIDNQPIYADITEVAIAPELTPDEFDCQGDLLPYGQDLWAIATISLHHADGSNAVAGTNGVHIIVNFDATYANGAEADHPVQFDILPGLNNTDQSLTSYRYREKLNGSITEAMLCDDIKFETVKCIESISGALPGSSFTTCEDFVAPSPSSCAEIYAYKKSRFPTVTGSDFPQGEVDPSVATAMGNQANADAKTLAGDMCSGNADAWMQILAPGLTAYSQSTIDGLKAKLIEVCSAGGDITHPMGASDLAGDASPGTSTYTSFGAAIKGELSLPYFTSQLNPWLFYSPVPYNTITQSVQNTVSNSSSTICNLLTAASAGKPSGTPLYTYLVSKFGDAMTLSSDDVDVLVNSCSNCQFILAHDITLPVFLDPSAKIVSSTLTYPGVIVKADYIAAKADMNSAFNNALSTTDDNYPEILSNYMNQRFGFSLTCDNYLNYEALIAPAGTDNVVLYNTAPFKPAVMQDPYACVKSSFETAISAGLTSYSDYIADMKQKFKANYVSTCSAAQAWANLDAGQSLYHFTLYYYDQADNLVRTIPPEGVHPLIGYALDQVNQMRLAAAVPSDCTYDGTHVSTSKSAMQTDLGSALSGNTSTGTAGIEMWLYSKNTSQLNEFVQVATDAGNNKTWLFSTAINGNVIGIDAYPMSAATSPPSALFYSASTPTTINSVHYRATIPGNLMPLLAWTHVVVQSTAGIGQVGTVPQIWVNGVQLTVTSGNSPLAQWSVAATSSGMQFPDITPNLMHIRFYQRELNTNTDYPTEIVTNAGNNCLMPEADFTKETIHWYRFNITDSNDPVTTAPSYIADSRVQDIYPVHTLPTSYAYNSTNQVVQQLSPDGGMNKFWYDMLSRLNISQNDRQWPKNQYSYTKYDVIGRITEVGQRTTTASIGDPGFLTSGTTSFYATGSNEQITNTWYDAVPTGVTGVQTSLGQNNLRKRVAISAFSPDPTTGVTQATYYNYDIDGNVSTLWQQVAGLGTKRLDYEFDLVSGKVNFVKYQDGQPDHFYYQYEYDADNRLTHAWSGTQVMYDSYSNTSRLMPDNMKLDAFYRYYLHGPLARVELGDQCGKVQGIDYAYTLQGWLKGVNGTGLAPNAEIGRDGRSGVNNHNIPADAYAFSLGYYNGDYKPVGGSGAAALAYNYQANSGDGTGQNLYNGNISNSTMAISNINSNNIAGYSYHYDQLNRLKTVLQSTVTGAGWNNNSLVPATGVQPGGDYAETFSYDGNGNITKAYRNGNSGNMDDLQYRYTKDLTTGYLVNNKLNQVNDASNNAAYTTDLKDQTTTNNYEYDATGNLVKDYAEGLGNDATIQPGVDWTVYGKIATIYKYDKTNSSRPLLNSIAYSYNASGQRVSKAISNGNTTYYVRDASGNTMAIYDNAGSTINWREQDLYGSSRLGMWQPNLDVGSTATVGITDTKYQINGLKQYELQNHLGNVMATISDRRVQVPDGSNNLDHLEADVINAQDYYAFGMQQPGRIGHIFYDASTQTSTWQTGTAAYRYGFNGKENDDDVKGEGDQQDYGMRIYDPRVGRFLSVDPLTPKYPELTPYQFANNSPIANIDLDGGENLYYEITQDTKKGTALIHLASVDHFPLEKIMPYNVFVSINGHDYQYVASFALSFESQRKMLKQELVSLAKNPQGGIQRLAASKAQSDQRNAEDKAFWDNIWVDGYTTAWGINRASTPAPTNTTIVNPLVETEPEPMPDIQGQAKTSTGVTVANSGEEVPIYRSGDTFNVTDNQIRINQETGDVKTTHGLSLHISETRMAERGEGVYRIKSIPKDLKIIQRGKDQGHYEIVPSHEMSKERYQELLKQIKTEEVKTSTDGK